MVYNQLDYLEELGTGTGATIHDFGCAETDVASILVNCFGKDTDPSRLNQSLISVNGYVSNGTGAYDILDWTAIARIYPDVTLAFNNLYPSSPADMSLIDSQLNKGCSVIVGVSFSHDVNATDPSHYVELYKKNPDGTYQCRDPWGGLDIVFDTKYAVNAMSIAQCILQAVSYNGPVQPTVDAQQIEDALRIARDTNWNLYQADEQRIKDLQTQLVNVQQQLTDCQNKQEVTPVTTSTTTEVPVATSTTEGSTIVNVSTTTTESATNTSQTQQPITATQTATLTMPKKQPLRLSDLIVYLFLRIKSILFK